MAHVRPLPDDKVSALRRCPPLPAWRRLVTEPRTGAVVDVGRARYQPPADPALTELEWFLAGRDA